MAGAIQYAPWFNGEPECCEVCDRNDCVPGAACGNCHNVECAECEAER